METLTEMFEYLLPFALKAGMRIPEFWDSTLGEINLILKTYGEARKEEQKIKLANQYNTAYLTATFVGSIFSGKPIPSIHKLFPDEFGAEIEMLDEEKQRLSTALYMEQMLDYANAHNKKRRAAKEGENK